MLLRGFCCRVLGNDVGVSGRRALSTVDYSFVFLAWLCCGGGSPRLSGVTRGVKFVDLRPGFGQLVWGFGLWRFLLVEVGCSYLLSFGIEMTLGNCCRSLDLCLLG